jgi:hypothetical protein
MATYSTKKAPARKNLSNPKANIDNAKKQVKKQSVQQQFAPEGARAVKPDSVGSTGKRYTGVTRTLSSQDSMGRIAAPVMQLAQNDKGTGVVKNARNAYRSLTYPPVINPDPLSGKRSGVNKAPGRRSPTTAPTI